MDTETISELGPLLELERERALATTPLLPPLMGDTNPVAEPTIAHPSPLESPTVALHSLPELPSSALASPLPTSPVLSSRPSVSSFHRVIIPVDFPNIPESDAWADRLGHANFTIQPQPYEPEVQDLESMHQLRADWGLARVNYTKHLVRTGEHYGTTSKIYALTEAKWAEVDGIWRTHFEETARNVVASGVAESCASRIQDIEQVVLPLIVHVGGSQGVACTLDLVEGSMTVKTTRKTYDPSINHDPKQADARMAQQLYEAAGKAGFQGTADRLAKLQVPPN